YEEVKHYLRRSFTKNDKRYDAQFWYARTLYLLGDQEYKDYFKYLSGVPLDVRIKRKPHGIVTEYGKEVVFEGSIIKLENSYGFLKQDITGETIYFHRGSDLGPIHYNSRVKFIKAFNYNGS